MIVTVFFFFFSLPLYVPTFEKVDKEKKTQAVAWQSRKSTIVRILFFFFVVHAITEPR